jgi:membrane-bound lytic murein transglycosylase D
MLKTKLKTGLCLYAFMFIAATSGGNLKQEPVAFENEIIAKALQEQIHAVLSDTSIFQLATPAQGEPSDSTEVVLKLEAPVVQLNASASAFTKDYLKKNNQSLKVVKKKSNYYFTIMDTVLKKYSLPVELKYLAVVESKLTSNALSRVGAKGPWQLMPATARCLGLKVTKKYDERTNTYRSSVAAAKYLRDLYRQYDDWLLVIAAYNAGPGKINSAIRKSGSRNFWVLQKYLPAETRGHVKKFIATHYYFEQKAGLVTMTKAERLEHQKKVSEFMAMQAKKAEEQQAGLAAADVSMTGEKIVLAQEKTSEAKLAKDK